MKIPMKTKRMFLSLAIIGAIATFSKTALVISQPASPTRRPAALIGAAAQGERAFEFIGRSDQDGSDVSHYGYLTHIRGLPDEALFSDPVTRTEATARFTYFGATSLNARHQVGSVLTTAAPGSLGIFFKEKPGADFNAPDSFKTGQAVASFSGRYHSVLSVEAQITSDSPGRGSIRAVAELTQNAAAAFSLEGRSFQFGHPEMRERLSASGTGTLTQAQPRKAFYFLGGDAATIAP